MKSKLINIQPINSSLKKKNATIFAKVWSAMQIRNKAIHTHLFSWKDLPQGDTVPYWYMDAHGHTIIHLPPYLQLESHWGSLASNLTTKWCKEPKTTADTFVEILEKLVQEMIKCVTKDNWAGCPQHIMRNWKSILQKRHIMDNTGDTFIINSGNNDSHNKDSSDNGSDSDNNYVQ